MSKKPKPVRADMLRKMEADARAIGGLIQEGIDDANHHYGFGLLLFSFDGSELTWISNARREDMIRLFEEMLANWKVGKMSDFPGGIDGAN